MSDLYSNWIPHLIGLIAILLLCLPTFYMDRIAERFQTHRLIKPEQVDSITYVSSPEKQRNIRPEYVRQIIDWYNQTIFIQKRKSANPKLQHPFLQITLHSGISITIFLSDTDIDIQRTNGKSNTSILYWAKQPHLRDYLSNQKESHLA